MREVFVQPGDLVDVTHAAELERNLRALGIFAEVEVRLVPATTEGEADLVVRTRDRLTLAAGGGASYVGGTSGLNANVAESNLFGLGDRAALSFRSSDDGEFRGVASWQDLHLFDTDPLKVRALAYDLVLNGWELGSGSIRIHEPELQRRVFNQLGISDEEADRRFGFFLQPFKYGAPPHGGFAFGIDRLAAILAGEENIREVIAFPKTQSGSDPMTNAPTPVESAQLAELGLRLLPPPASS